MKRSLSQYYDIDPRDDLEVCLETGEGEGPHRVRITFSDEAILYLYLPRETAADLAEQIQVVLSLGEEVAS